MGCGYMQRGRERLLSCIYNEQIEVSFIKRIREEISFDNLDALKIQLEQDEYTAKAILS